MEKSYSEIFARAWRLRQQMLSREGGSADQPDRGAPAVGAVVAATAAAAAGNLPEPKAKGKAKAKAKAATKRAAE
eukprot:9160010-Pyramimonas_sp.AAC.1